MLVTTARDLFVIVLSFNALHIGLNVGGDYGNSAGIDECPYATWYSAMFALFMLASASSSLVAIIRSWKYHGAVSLTVDGLALPIGLFWLATTKPNGWYAAAAVPGCDMFTVPWAWGLFLLAEVLTFGSAIRGAILAYSVGMPRLSAAIIIVGTFALSALMYITAHIIRTFYGLND